MVQSQKLRFLWFLFFFCHGRIYFVYHNILFSVPLHNVILTRAIFSLINLEEHPSQLPSKKSSENSDFIYWFILFHFLSLPCLVWLSDQFNKKWKTGTDCVIKQSRLLKAPYDVFNILFKIQIWNRDMLNKMDCWYLISVHIIAMNKKSHWYTFWAIHGEYTLGTTQPASASL